MLDLLLLALALSMDAFAVSVGLGIKQKKSEIALALKAGLFFGFFQAFMPFLGYLGGVGLTKYIQGFDHIIAFILLLIIGVKMLYEASLTHTVDTPRHISYKALFFLAIATSIDAMAAGFTIHLFPFSLCLCLIIIGLTTFIISFIGVLLGKNLKKRKGEKFEKQAEFIGGTILILLGLKILLFS